MKNFKRILALVTMLVMVTCLLAGCGGSGNAPASNAPASKAPASDGGSVTVGVSVASATNNPHIVDVCSTLQQSIQEAGWTCILQDANNDSSTQSTQFDNLVTQEVDVIVYWANDPDAAVADMKKAHDAGIPVVVYFADVSEEAHQYAECYVGADQLVIAAAVANAANDALGGSGNIVIVNGKEGKSDFIQRSQGFRDTIATLGDYNILAEEYSDTDRTKAQTIMENYLTTYSDIDGVFVTNDDIGVGVFNALDAAGRNDIQIFSIDGIQQALQLIKEGKWYSDIYQTPKMMADKCVEVVKQMLDGSFAGEYNQNTDYYVVTAANVDDYLE